jgi:mannose-6-phosphate isomerase-like protein (cupin superfamily)
MRTKFLAAAVALLALAAAPPPDVIQVNSTKIVWKDGPPTLPKGTKVAVLEGDPKQPGMFTMRLRVPAGSKVMPHWHPRPERVTILSGKVAVGFGDKWDDKELRRFGPGDFYVNPPESHHYVFFPRTSVIQITGEGPWELHPLP